MFTIKFRLDEKQMDQIAAKVEQRMIDGAYMKLGKSIGNKIFYVVGGSAFAVLSWFHVKGII